MSDVVSSLKYFCRIILLFNLLNLEAMFISPRGEDRRCSSKQLVPAVSCVRQHSRVQVTYVRSCPPPPPPPRGFSEFLTPQLLYSGYTSVDVEYWSCYERIRRSVGTGSEESSRKSCKRHLRRCRIENCPPDKIYGG